MLETVLDHHSVRGFLPRRVARGYAGTAGRRGAVRLHLVQSPVLERGRGAGAERKSRLAELAGQQQFIRDAPLLLVWLADLSRLDRIAAERQAQVDGTHYLEEFIVGVVDAALAAQSALIAAEVAPAWAASISARCAICRSRSLPNSRLPPHVFAVFGMSVGYPDPDRPTDIKPRLPQSVVLHRERSSAVQRSDAIDGYNATIRGFQREQGMKPIDWTRQCFNRVKDAVALRGRDRMREALRNLGFELR